MTVLKAGLPVSGTVVAVRQQGKFKGEGNLGIQLSRVGAYEVATQEYEQTVKGKGKRTGAMVGGGAAGGALIGGVAGGGKGALIGGLVGAGAGTVGAAATGNKGVSIPAESVVSFISASPITVTLKPKPVEGVAASQSPRREVFRLLPMRARWAAFLLVFGSRERYSLVEGAFVILVLRAFRWM